MKRDKIFSMCNIFLMLLLLNEITSFLFSNASIGSRFLYYSVIAISLFYWMRVVLAEEKMPPLLRAWSVLLILFTAYGLPLIVSGKMFIIKENFRHIPGEEFLKLIYYSMLPLFPIYEFAKKGELTPSKLKIVCLLLLLTSTFQYNEYYSKMLSYAKDRGLTVREFTNNSGYLFLQIIPLVLVFRKQKILMVSILIYCMYMIMIGMKRGAILLAIPSVLILLLELYKYSTKRQKVFIVLITIGVIAFCVELFQYMLETSDYFNMRLQKTLSGNTSHRDVIYAQAIDVFLQERNVLFKFFGHGGYSTLDLMLNNAHNDWFEILVNHGIIGVMIFLFLCFQMFMTVRQAKRYDSSLYISLLIVAVIFIGRTLFSMSYSDVGRGLIIAMGYGIAQLNLLQNKKDDFEKVLVS